MFLPLFVFAFILMVPLVVSFILIRLCHIDETLPQARVPASYWGRYAGTVDAPGAGTVALHDPTKDLAAPTQIPTHALHWHP